MPDETLRSHSKHPLFRAFLWGFVFGTLGVFALALIPLTNSSGGRDARNAEGEQLGGSARDLARVEYSKADGYQALLVTNVEAPPDQLPDNFCGSWYGAVDVVEYHGPDEGAVYIIPIGNNYDHPTLRLDFHWQSGKSTFQQLGPFAGAQQ